MSRKGTRQARRVDIIEKILYELIKIQFRSSAKNRRARVNSGRGSQLFRTRKLREGQVEHRTESWLEGGKEFPTSKALS